MPMHLRDGHSAFQLNSCYKLHVESCDFDLSSTPIPFIQKNECLINTVLNARQKHIPRETNATNKMKIDPSDESECDLEVTEGFSHR